MKLFNAVLSVFILTSAPCWADSKEETCPPEKEIAPLNWKSAKSIKEHMVYKLVPVKGEQTIAPNIVLYDPSLADTFSEIYLERTENLDDGERFTLHIIAQYSDKKQRNYSKAKTPKGKPLNFSKQSQSKLNCDSEDTCQYQEKMEIGIDFFEIVDVVTSRLEFTLIGDMGEESNSIKVPGKYFLAMMQSIQAE